MHYKKWIFLLFSFSLFLYSLLSLLYIVVDPEQVFKKSITKYKFGYTKYYSKHQYQKLKENDYILVFGTSRSQNISSDSQHIDLLNFHNIYGEPGDILNFMQQLTPQQIKHVKHIYYLVSLTTMRDETDVLNYKKYGFIDQLEASFPLNNLGLKNLARDIYNNVRNESIYYYIDNDGSQFLYNKNQTTVLNHTINQPLNININQSQAIQTLGKLDYFCKSHKIKITYFTPTYTDKYKINTEQLQFLWKKLFNNGIDGFYALYYLKGVSDNMRDNHYVKFTDSSHLNYTNMNNVFKEMVLNKNPSFFIKDSQESTAYFKSIER